MSDLTKEEQARVRNALRHLRIRFGTWHALGRALRIREDALAAVARGGGVTASLSFRVARLASVSIDDVLSGAYPKPTECPYCGHIASVSEVRHES